MVQCKTQDEEEPARPASRAQPEEYGSEEEAEESDGEGSFIVDEDG